MSFYAMTILAFGMSMDSVAAAIGKSTVLQRWAEVPGGVVLMGIGSSILVEHLGLL